MQNPQMPNAESRARASSRAQPANPRAPFFFVLFALAALGALPFFTIGTIARYRNELNQLYAARDMTNDQLVALALAEDLLRDYLETTDTTLLDRYHVAVSDDQRARQRLKALLPVLEPTVQRRYDEMERTHTLFQKRVEELLAERPRPIERIEAFLSRETLYEESLIATAELDRAISQITNIQRANIDRAQRMALVLTVALMVLAIAAAVAVELLGRRLRAFALEAETNRRELQHVLSTKERFTRGITHDLKNPLGVIVGHAALLQEGVRGELSREQRDDIDRIKRSATSMLGLLDTMLELARVESGNIAIRKTDVDLSGLISELAENYRPSAEQAGLTLETKVAEDARIVQTDSARVMQVLGNLISNAVKYTPSGRVEVRAETGNGSAPRAGEWVAVRVIDTGRGIPAERQDQIFAEFSRLEAENVQGAGLGLAISRNLARLLGGDITVQSEPGRGSAFTLWLPR